MWTRDDFLTSFTELALLLKFRLLQHSRRRPEIMVHRAKVEFANRIELTLYYCLFAIGSRLSPPNFRFATDKDIRGVKPTSVASAFGTAYPSDALTVALQRVLAMPEFAEWTEVRNVLAHRVVLGRAIYMGKVPTRVPLSELRVSALRIPLTDQATAARRA